MTGAIILAKAAPMPDALTFSGRLARARFRAWHRGTREADYTIGGFFDRYHAEWNEAELDWFRRHPAAS